MIRFGVIGCGQWGPNHIRNFMSFPESSVIMCADLNSQRLSTMKNLYRSITTTLHAADILRNADIDAVIICTPTETHFKLVKQSLEARKHVLCEKPLCLKVQEAEELNRLAKRHNRILMVGHVFLFNAGIKRLREMIQHKKCGRIFYLHSKRTNLGPFRTDVNSVWDLASHDVYIFNYLLNALPEEVSARGGCYLQKSLEDVSFISLIYPKGILVNIHVSWLDPRKVRQITVIGDKKMLIWDDLDTAGPIKIYDRQVVPSYHYETYGDFHLLAKEGNVTIPKLSLFEPLKAQDAHFLECVRTRKMPFVDGKSSQQAIRVLEAIQKSLRKKGGPVRVS